jgi:hypothetical protein
MHFWPGIQEFRVRSPIQGQVSHFPHSNAHQSLLVQDYSQY